MVSKFTFPYTFPLAHGALLGNRMLMILMLGSFSLFHGLKVVSEVTQTHGVATNETHNVVNDLPRIAVMISGIYFEQAMRTTHGNIIDYMGGGDDDSYDQNEKRTPQGPRPWDTFKEHVVRPLKRDFQERVDIFVCTNKIVGDAPGEITAAFTINSTGSTPQSHGISKEQFDRAQACFSKVAGFGRKYSYFMKVRPDFVFLTDIEDYSELRRDCMHSRFQRAWNIDGFRRCQSQLINRHCTSCNGQYSKARAFGPAQFGWIVDDMVFVAPFEIAKSVFMTGEEIQQLSNVRISKRSRWIGKNDLNMSTEGIYTNALVLNKVPMCPLCINGWPRGSNRDWSEHHAVCPNADAAYPCGRQRASVDEWVEYIKTGRLPGVVQKALDREGYDPRSPYGHGYSPDNPNGRASV